MRMHMAADLDLEKETAVHQKGYLGFVGLMKWGTIISVITAIIVVFIIAE
ncbi:MAG TPA: aa3-type cytochrome c oxidase subunit IV [Allosphingosinicella sp.]|nr:aa3-type cytochrome c oxidase subunit IV [Allosphingosinicella sp.]